MSEWGAYLEEYVASLDLQPHQHEAAARFLLDDCIEHEEISHYQAHLLMGRFLDSRGYS